MNDGFLKDFFDGRKYQTDLVVALLLAILGLACALALPDGNTVRIVFGIAMLIFIPGYSMVSALWPRATLVEQSGSKEKQQDEKSIDNLERITLSFGLSIVLLSLTGLMLNFTSMGITLESTLASNVILIVVFVAIAHFRRRRMPSDEVFHMDLRFTGQMPRDRTERLITAAIAVSLVLAGITLVYSLTIPSAEDQYSSLFILDANGTAQDYPVNLNTSSNGTVIVGITCHEFETTRYTILAGIEGANSSMDYQNWTQTFILNNSVLISRNITLDHQESFQEEFTFRIASLGTYKVNWIIEINGIQTDYSTHLWVVVHAD